MMTKSSSLLLLLVAVSSVAAFTASSSSRQQTTTTTTTSTRLYNVGGWGIGQSRDLTPEEFANRGERRGTSFEGYKLQNRGDFMRQVREDSENLKKSELEELMGVASIAGINVKNPKERLNKYEQDVFAQDEEEDLDLSV